MGLFRVLQVVFLLEVSTMVLGQQISTALLTPEQLLGVRLQQLFNLRIEILNCVGQLICGAKSVVPFTTEVSCVPISNICDSIADCSTYADEAECPINCHGKVRCADDCTCAVPCDGITQCPGGEDEAQCSPACQCGALSYLCNDGSTCVPRSALCDFNNDCPAGDDETGCASTCRCNAGSVACLDGQTCIGVSQVCNNLMNECPGNEDESSCPMGCQCGRGFFFCANGERCVSSGQLCNGTPNECCLGNATACAGNLNEDEQCLPDIGSSG